MIENIKKSQVLKKINNFFIQRYLEDEIEYIWELIDEITYEMKSYAEEDIPLDLIHSLTVYHNHIRRISKIFEKYNK